MKKLLSPDSFYDDEYLPVIEEISTSFIDQTGPITFKYLNTKVARIHGFKRTGAQIKKQVWAAIYRERSHNKTPDQQTVFWPEGVKIKEVCDFNGIKNDGERVWSDVPYPEKLGLAVSIISKNYLHPGIVRVRLGTIETEIKEKPEAHIFVSSKANWEEINDNLPQYNSYE